MVRLLIEDVTLIKATRDVTIHLRFKGGAHFSAPATSGIGARRAEFDVANCR